MTIRFTFIAVLVFTGTAALAQSNVTLSGRIDLNMGRDIGGNRLRMGTGAANYISFAGTEDLGGGAQAFFKLTTRINSGNGTTNVIDTVLNSPEGTFWSQESYMGLRGTWGSLTLGRQTTAALLPQVLADPWLWDNVTSGIIAGLGLVGNVWYNQAVTYAYDSDGFSFSAQAAQKDSNPGWAGKASKTPYSLSLGYAPGPWQVRVGYEKPADGRSRLASVFGSYSFGTFILSAMAADGKDFTGAHVRTWAVSSVIFDGADQFRASVGQYKREGIEGSQKLSLGYYHSLSTHTSLYANLAYERKAPAYRTAYEVGLQHTF